MSIFGIVHPGTHCINTVEGMDEAQSQDARANSRLYGTILTLDNGPFPRPSGQCGPILIIPLWKCYTLFAADWGCVYVSYQANVTLGTVRFVSDTIVGGGG